MLANTASVMSVVIKSKFLANDCASSAQASAIDRADSIHCIAKRSISVKALGLILWLTPEQRARK
jgi:hypothetical protein